MRPTEHQLRQQLEKYCRRLGQRGWVANHDGNISVKSGNNRLLCTPTAESKIELGADAMLMLDLSGKKLSGQGRPFSELNLHLAYFHQRSDVNAVIHAHPPVATAYGVARQPLEHPFLPEAVVSLGPWIPLVALALPGHDAVQAIAPYLDEHDVLMLEGNGVIACGADLEQAYLRLELLEHLCVIAKEARQLGGVKQLPQSMLTPLLRSRTKAGLGPEARGVAATSQVPQTAASDLEALVRTEISKVISQK